jgi:hypothetical protein
MAKKRAKTGPKRKYVRRPKVAETMPSRLPPKPVTDDVAQLIHDVRDTNLPPNEQFMVNVRTFMNIAGFDTVQQLCDSMGLRDEQRDKQRKWLRRVALEGLKRPDKRRLPLLEKLATTLNCNVVDFWNPTADIDPMKLAEKPDQWRKLIHRVIEWTKTWEMVKKYDPQKTRDIIKKFKGTEEELLTEWIASECGARRPRLRKDNVRSLMNAAIDSLALQDWHIEIAHTFDFDYGNMPDVPGNNYVVWEKASQHESWDEFEQTYIIPRIEERQASRRKEGLPEPEDEKEDFWHCWTNFLSAMTFRQPTSDEVFEQFKRTYLEKDSPDQRAYWDGVPLIMASLTKHKGWPPFVKHEHKGDKALAENFVTDMWWDLILKLGPNGMPTESFSLYFHKKHLDKYLE